MTGLRIRLVRHGQSTWNVEGRVQGQTVHVPLTAVGVAQAQEVATSLAALPIQRLYTSDLVRALQTAEVVSRATGLAVRSDARLRERGYGVLEGRPNHEVPMLGAREGGAPPGGESFGDVVRRVGGLLDECREDAVLDGLTEVAMVTHGDTIQAALSWLGDASAGTVVTNGSVVVADVGVGRPQPVVQRLSR